jgi:glycyl-tRNA synthetase
MKYEEVMNLATRRGFFLRSAESYPNIPAGFWDYGPLGVLFKNRFIETWRRSLVKRDGMIEIDTAQIMPKEVFVASGHLESFTDPVIECSKCHSIFRADKLVEEKIGGTIPEKLDAERYDELFQVHNISCPNCRSVLKGTRRFNMMFGVGIGPQKDEAYLRPETCQGIFVDFPFLFKTQRIKLPQGFAQFGKSFRNEIAPRQGILRQREFYQAEIEVLFNPDKLDDERFDSVLRRDLLISKTDGEPKKIQASEAIKEGIVPNKLIAYYLHLIQSFYQETGLNTKTTRLRRLSDEERAFYSSVAFDLEAKTSLGWLELVACNYRSDYDLRRHSEVSGSDFTVNVDGKKILPHVFELSMGVDRSLYAILESAYTIEGERTYLALKPSLAPIQVGVFPLVSKDGLPEVALRIYKMLNRFEAIYDESGSIGRRYARADEVGVPFCITIDHGTLNDSMVTVRHRDNKIQERTPIDGLEQKLEEFFVPPTI